MFQPLSGVRVVDLTQVLAGPYATYQLALMGADVIKVERPGSGDWTRFSGGGSEFSTAGMSPAYMTQNANKKSLTVDLKSQRGVDIIKQLVARADVFVENFSPGAIKRLGLDFETLKALNPKIVYCSISAYGQDGPLSSRPGYDHVVQGMCGIMKTTGTDESGPTKVGAPYIDYATGMNAALAIVSGLMEARSAARAVLVDVAMLDSAMLLMASLMSNYLTTGEQPQASGNSAWSGSPSSGAFDTTDGTLMLAANNEAQFKRLCAALDCEDVLSDERFAEPAVRAQNSQALREVFADRFRTRSADEWEAFLADHAVPAARVRTVGEVLSEEQLRARQICAPIEVSALNATAHVPTLGFKADGAVMAASTPPPTLSQDTDTVLQELGLSGGEIAELRRDGIV